MGKMFKGMGFGSRVGLIFSANVVCFHCGGQLATGRMFRCVVLDSRLGLGRAVFSGSQVLGTSWKKVSHLPTGPKRYS